MATVFVTEYLREVDIWTIINTIIHCDYGFVFHDLIRYELAARKRSSKKGLSNHGAAVQRCLVAPGCIL